MSLWSTLTAMSRNGQQQGYVLAWMYTARGEGGAPLYGPYGDVPLDRVWFSSSLS